MSDEDYGLKMTMLATRISAWGRYQWLAAKETVIDEDEIIEFKYLSDWWHNIGEKRDAIMKQAEELAKQAPETNDLWNQNTKGAHSPKIKYNAAI
jgi:hypothetical protein